jgi:dienelactone hydrolase
MTGFIRLVAALGALACLCAAYAASAQQEFPPPQGKAPLVVMASGMSGPEHYTTVARDIARMGFDVMLFDGNSMEGTQGAGVQAAIVQAQAQAQHALPGKVALVGFSLGGGMDLFYGSRLSDLAVGAVVWYPATTFIKNVPHFVDILQMPVLMFAGESDTFRGCCLIDHARELAAAATAGGKPFELVTYPNTDHDFVKDGAHYNPSAYADALQRTGARLKRYFGQ